MSRTDLSTTDHDTDHDDAASLGTVPDIDSDHAPRLEPWLGISLLAVVPMLAAFLIPKEHIVFAAAISGILLIVGIAMLVVQERRR
jgi:hypothetical protein